jgi:SAM-dependent methyltransferase
MAPFETSEIRRYYDRHTRAFLRYGQGGGAGVIHRAVWGPGASTRQQAFHYVDEKIAGLASSFAVTASTQLHLVDLGCGVGATLCYLAERLPAARGTGVTISPLQAQIAAERIRAAGLADRVACIEADYTNLPGGIAPADLAYAIESFVHGPSPERFFAECSRLVRPGGVLVIVDDFRRRASSADAARAVDRFCRGWRINTLLTRDGLIAMARQAGFEHESTTDLSPMLEIRRTRDRAIDVLAAVLGWLRLNGGRFGYLAGGSALQKCLARGWIGYEFNVFRRART